jgi:hypothetical protein
MTSLNIKWPVVIAASVVVLGAGVALAVWQLGGSGNARADVATAQNLTASPATPTTPLYPGGEGDLAFTVTNPNDFDVEVTGATFGTPVAEGCTNPAVTVSGSVQATVVPAGDTADINVGVTMGDSSSDCQGKSLTIPVNTITAVSVGD